MQSRSDGAEQCLALQPRFPGISAREVMPTDISLCHHFCWPWLHLLCFRSCCCLQSLHAETVLFHGDEQPPWQMTSHQTCHLQGLTAVRSVLFQCLTLQVLRKIPTDWEINISSAEARPVAHLQVHPCIIHSWISVSHCKLLSLIRQVGMCFVVQHHLNKTPVKKKGATKLLNICQVFSYHVSV